MTTHRMSVWHDTRGWNFCVRAVNGTGLVSGQLPFGRDASLQDLRGALARSFPMPHDDAAWIATKYGLGWDCSWVPALHDE